MGNKYPSEDFLLEVGRNGLNLRHYTMETMLHAFWIYLNTKTVERFKVVMDYLEGKKVIG